ncbi:MAG TPA: hypothetical protein VHV30_14420, partial [Polyangiaceae bacterium]|nr:hypothetical protein [Polyangiaceae bacterium]
RGALRVRGAGVGGRLGRRPGERSADVTGAPERWFRRTRAPTCSSRWARRAHRASRAGEEVEARAGARSR